MWAFWAVILVFWSMVYIYNRFWAKPKPSIYKSSKDKPRCKSSPTIDAAAVIQKCRKSADHSTANDRDSDAEERSSLSSDDDSVSSTVSETDHNDKQEVVRFGLGQVIVESSRFNTLFHRIAVGQNLSPSHNRQKRWRAFFAVGQLISVILIIPCFVLLVLMLFSMFQDAIRQIPENWAVQDKHNGSLNTPYNNVIFHKNNRAPATVPATTTTVPVHTTAVADDSRFKAEAVVASHSTVIDAGVAGDEMLNVAESPLPPSIVVYSAKPARSTNTDDFGSNWIPHMKFLLPGFNIEASQLLILFLAVLICTIVHESGHAISAVAEGLPLDSVGFAFVICFPIAFAKVDVDSTSTISDVVDDSPTGKASKARQFDRVVSATTKKLRVLCAGVWCNVVFCVVCLVSSLLISFCLLLLSSFMSSLCDFTTTHGGRLWTLQRDGVLVTNVSTESVQYSHLLPGDRVTALNGCNIHSMEDLYRCLALEPFGYCLRDDEVRHIKVKASPLKALTNVLSTGEPNHHKCCGSSPAALAAGLCFSRAEVYNQSFAEVQCLNIRRLLQFNLDNMMCFNSSNDCAPGSNKHCYMPVLDRNERLYIIDKYPGASSLNDSHDDILFAVDHHDGANNNAVGVTHVVDVAEKEKIVIIGSARDVLSTKFMPSFRNVSLPSNATTISMPFISFVRWIYTVMLYFQTLINTCAGVSIAIALLNIVPCVHLDGDKIVQVIVTETLHLENYEQFASFLTNAIIYAGTTLVMLTVAVAFGNALLDAW